MALSNAETNSYLQPKVVSSASSRGWLVGARASALTVPAAALLGLTVLAGCTITPKPVTQLELADYAQDKLERVTQNQEPVSGQITLYDALARALKYNLDYRVEMMNRVVANKNLRLKSAAMLPDLVVNAGYSNRNNTAASYSENLFTGVRTVQPTFSTEKGTFAGDTTFTWHLLDFGLSYVRAQQAADEALIAEEMKRKIIIQITEDVRVAYWRAVSADRLLQGFHKLRHRVENALSSSKKLYRARQTSPVAALSYQRELVDIKRQIHRLERELTTAKLQLAALMNVDPGSQFTLHVPERRLTDLAIKASADEMISLALENRPEIRDVAYRERINEKEVKAALLEILPGVSVNAGFNWDSNDFLYNSNWVGYGAKVGWNLMKLFQYPARKDAIDARKQLLDEKALATTMAIMTQVHVARARYKYLFRSAETAAEYYTVQRNLLNQIRASVSANVASEQTLIREEMNTLVAAAQFDLAYADLQNAFAAIYASVGIDPFEEGLSTDMSVADLSAALRQTWRNRGDLHN